VGTLRGVMILAPGANGQRIERTGFARLILTN
jgi:hypothetical protein